jgi:hypothetical protein
MTPSTLDLSRRRAAPSPTNPAGAAQLHTPARGPRVSWLDPEGPHSVENIDDHVDGAFRIEFKRLRPPNPGR